MSTTMTDGDNDVQREYLRRAAEAAERTRRNSTILVWALVGVPVIVGLVAVLVFVLGGAAANNAASAKQSAADRVAAVYHEVGYAPPAYTDIPNQTRGICENLAKGLSRDDAASQMAQGFGEGLTYVKAQKIVQAVAENPVC